MILRPAAFIDRDGVLNQDTGYVFRSADFHWLDGVFDALRLLRDAGRALVVVTNQSGIARGMYTEDDHSRLCAWMRVELHARGLELAAIEHCPHLPHAPVAAYRVDCDCRKPRPGMILRACARLGLDPTQSCLFGDKASDIVAGRAAGVRHNRLIDPSVVAATARASSVDGPDSVHVSLLDAVRAELADVATTTRASRGVP